MEQVALEEYLCSSFFCIDVWLGVGLPHGHWRLMNIHERDMDLILCY